MEKFKKGDKVRYHSATFESGYRDGVVLWVLPAQKPKDRSGRGYDSSIRVQFRTFSQGFTGDEFTCLELIK